MNFDAIRPVIQHFRSGKLRALAVTAATRAAGLLDVPTIAESGYEPHPVVLDTDLG